MRVAATFSSSFLPKERRRLADATVMAFSTSVVVNLRIRRRCRSGILFTLLAASAWAQDTPAQAPALQTGADTSIPADPAASAGAGGAGFYSRFRLHAYADVDFSHNAQNGEPNHYSVDEIDLFGTAAITPALTAVAEVVIDTGGTPTLSSVPLNVERLLLQYRVNQYFQVEAGQFRTALGYYSTAYLRGAWFQTAISRPRLFAFRRRRRRPAAAHGWCERIRRDSVRVAGTPLHRTDRQYPDLGIAGRQRRRRRNAVNVAVYARPRPVPGLELGISEYHNPYSPSAASRWTAAARGLYREPLRVSERRRRSAPPLRSRQCDRPAVRLLLPAWVPDGSQLGSFYARVEKISIHADPFFNALSAQAPWRSMYTTGVRYDWNDHVAVKLEFGREADSGSAALPSGSGPGCVRVLRRTMRFLLKLPIVALAGFLLPAAPVAGGQGFSVVVHRSNPVSNLGVAGLRDIFTGAVTHWPNQSRIVLAQRAAAVPPASS